MTSRVPSVTVVIPTRDRWPLLARTALSAALGQEEVDLEVVVVDDGSGPRPEELPGFDDRRVRVVRHDEPRGVAAARNSGIAAARGEWIAFLDDDDAWSPRKLTTQLRAIRHASADLAYSGVVSVDREGRVLHAHPVPSGDRVRLDLLATCAIPAGPSNVLVRTELIRSIGGFDEELAQLADWDCWIRLAWAGTAVGTPGVLVAYLEHPGSASLSLSRRAFRELAYLEKKHRALRAQHGVALDRLGFSHDIAWLQLRRRRYARAAAIYLRSTIENRRLADVIPAARFAARALVPLRRTPRPVVPAVVPDLAWLQNFR